MELHEQNPEQIKEQIEGTREALTEKIQSLEHGVSDTIQDAKSSVQETVAEVKSFFDFKQQCSKHPLLCLGGSIVAGYFIEQLTSPAAVTKPFSPPITPRTEISAPEGNANGVITDNEDFVHEVKNQIRVEAGHLRNEIVKNAFGGIANPPSATHI